MAVVFNGGVMGGGGTLAVPTPFVKVIADGTPTDFATIALGDPTSTAGEVFYRVVAVKAADRQVLSGRIRYTGTRSGSTYADSAGEVGGQTTSVTTGTLAGHITATAASGVLTFSANFNSSLTTPVVTLYYVFDFIDAIGPVTL